MKPLSLLFVIILFVTAVHADERSSYGIASAHPLATAAGNEILQKGGNAFDAAVAVSSTLAVVEPYASGIGGGGFWLLHRKKDNSSIVIDGREKAPLNAHKSMYLDKQGQFIKNLSIKGALSSGIPGVPAALDHITKKYGRLTLAENLSPAIRLAKQGFQIDEKYRLYAKLRLASLREDAETARIFLLDNEVPPDKYILKQPDLSNTLINIASQGSRGFYTGKTAQKLVNGVNNKAGIWTIKDLEQYAVVERNPISFTYRNLKITSASPPSSGGIALAEILGILEKFDLNNMDTAQRKHIIIEAMKRAYADRAQYLGDPDFTNIPDKRLMGKKHLTKMASDINLHEATPSEFISSYSRPDGNGNDTTHFSIIDNEGNMVSATLSINYPFGACLVPPGTGVLLNDEMDDFAAKPGTANAYGLIGGEANAIEPGKRPLSSMSPTLIVSDNAHAVLGTPGGSRIITMVLLAILDFANGASALDIVSNRRFHHQYLPDIVMYEDNALTEKEIETLANMGHQLKRKMSPYGGGQGSYGNMQIVVQHSNGSITAASDPRGHGKALISSR